MCRSKREMVQLYCSNQAQLSPQAEWESVYNVNFMTNAVCSILFPTCIHMLSRIMRGVQFCPAAHTNENMNQYTYTHEPLMALSRHYIKTKPCWESNASSDLSNLWPNRNKDESNETQHLEPQMYSNEGSRQVIIHVHLATRSSSTCSHSQSFTAQMQSPHSTWGNTKREMTAAKVNGGKLCVCLHAGGGRRGDAYKYELNGGKLNLVSTGRETQSLTAKTDRSRKKMSGC